jgi:hypothetical protein
MAVQHANRGIVKKDLQLYYNREFLKSFRGQATTNIVSNTTDFSGLSYAGYSTEWTSDPTRFTKSYNAALQTPIGTGATLLTESGTTGYHHLSRLGGGGTGGHSISCYVYPVNGNITNFTIGMLGDGASTAIFNLVTGTVVSTGVRVSNAFITKVSGWLGWYRVGANIGGREGGWVGAVGLDVQTSYTPSLPYKSMYVTGLQYEDTKTYCTPFVVGSNRSANTVAGGGGLLDISGNNNQSDLSNSGISFDSGGFYFNGDTAGAITIPIANSILDTLSNNTHTYEVWFKLLGTPPGVSDGYFFGRQGYHEGFAHFKSTPTTFGVLSWYNDNNNTGWLTYAGSLNVWYHAAYVVNVETSNRQLYVNGALYSSSNLTGQLKQYVSGPSYYYYFGSANPNYSSNIIMSSAKAYNRALTAAEISQNFNATRKTYGI